MVYRISLASMLLLALTLIPLGAGYGQVTAQEKSTTLAFNLSSLPPGIEKKVTLLLDELMSHHHMMEMETGHGMHHEHHMGQIQEMIDQLPPGILVQVLQAMLQLDMMQMMELHQDIDAGLLDQPPGQILNSVQGRIR